MHGDQQSHSQLLDVMYHTHTHPFKGPLSGTTQVSQYTHTHTHTHTRLTALCPGLPRWASTTKVKPIWILLEQEKVSGSGISWAIWKSAPRSRQITTPAPHCSVFYRPDALPAAQPTVSKHWRHMYHSSSRILKHPRERWSGNTCKKNQGQRSSGSKVWLEWKGIVITNFITFFTNVVQR